MEAVFSFEIFVFSYQTARYHNTADHNMLYNGTSDRQKQQRSEVVYLKNMTSFFFDLSSRLLVFATFPAYLFLDACVHYLITLSLFHTSYRRMTSPTNEQWIRKNMDVIVVCSWMYWGIPRYTTEGSQIPVRDLNPETAKSVAVVTAGTRRSLYDMLTGPKVVKRFSIFHGTRRFITAFIIARHVSLFWVRAIHAILPHPTSWSFILVLCFHIYGWLPVMERGGGESKGEQSRFI